MCKFVTEFVTNSYTSYIWWLCDKLIHVIHIIILLILCQKRVWVCHKRILIRLTNATRLIVYMDQSRTHTYKIQNASQTYASRIYKSDSWPWLMCDKPYGVYEWIRNQSRTRIYEIRHELIHSVFPVSLMCTTCFIVCINQSRTHSYKTSHERPIRIFWRQMNSWRICMSSWLIHTHSEDLLDTYQPHTWCG